MRGTTFAIAEIVWWMIAAGTTGVLLGWIVRGHRRDADIKDEFAAMARTAQHEHQRLLDELVAAQAELEELAGRTPESTEATTVDDGGRLDDLQRRLDAANARIVLLEGELHSAGSSAETATPLDPLAAIAERTRGADPPADDDLKRIRGVGPRLEEMLKEAGITSFRQVARLTPEDIAVITEALKAFKGRIERDNWMGSAAEQHFAEYGEPVD